MAERSIPITVPEFGPEEEAQVLAVLRSGWVAQGPKVAAFEQAVADYTGLRHAVATTSCTTALHLSLITAGIGPGDEVIVPAFTWIATANVVEYVGARPVFCDVDLATFNLDVDRVIAVASERTRAVLPVSLFGLSAPMGPLAAEAERRGWAVIEDAACALGSSYDGRHAGHHALSACLSFHPRKVITTGEGGMVITNDDEVATRCRVLRDHGAVTGDLERHTSKEGYLLSSYDELGFNYRMTDLQAALGLAQMTRLPKIRARRRQLAERYTHQLASLSWLRTPHVPADCAHGYQAYVCLYASSEPDLDGLNDLHARRNCLMARLAEAGVATRTGTHAVHCQGYYARRYGLAPADFPNAWISDRLSLAIPLYSGMTDYDQDRIIALLGACDEGS